jgi:hypothetical protein
MVDDNTEGFARKRPGPFCTPIHKIFETADDLEKKKPVAIPSRAGSPRLGLAGLKATAQARRARLVAAK